MRKIVATINLSIDGFCNHDMLHPDGEVHQHYTDLLNGADVILYGRTTYELMEYWRPFIEKPTGEKEMDDFALAIDSIQKIVFSNTLKNTDWKSGKVATQSLEETAAQLKQQSGRDILVGSRSIIVQLSNLGLIDEYQLCIHPVLVGKGLPLFDKINNRTVFELIKTKTFKGGAVIHYYKKALQG